MAKNAYWSALTKSSGWRTLTERSVELAADREALRDAYERGSFFKPANWAAACSA